MRKALVVFGCLLCGFSAAAQLSSRTLHYTVPDTKGALEIALPDFSIRSVALQTEDGLWMFADHKPTDMTVNIRLRRAPQPGITAKECRKRFYGDKGQVYKTKNRFWFGDNKQYQDEVLSERGAMALAEFTIRSIGQKHLLAYLATDQLWAEVEITKDRFKAEDARLFEAILDTVHLNPSYILTSYDHLAQGSLLYLGRDYRNAAKSYQRALDLEKQDSQLGPTLWHVLVDNLGMSYGMTGELGRAKEIFEYGLSKDPAYPLFYYNLACTYAEMKELDNALAYLQKAFEYRKNVLPGEKMPDPTTDDSFKRYLKNEKFRKVVDALPRD